MDTFVQRIFLQELDTQCKFALNAAKALNDVMTRYGAMSRSRDEGLDPEVKMTLHAEVFRTIHSLLTHASNASKILWPVASGDKSRGRHLREILGIGEQSHPLRNRTLRDHLEHFDERIDKWAAGGGRVFAHDIIGPLTLISGLNPQDRMRWYDSENATMNFRGESYDIKEVVGAVQDIRERLAPHLARPPFD